MNQLKVEHRNSVKKRKNKKHPRNTINKIMMCTKGLVEKTIVYTNTMVIPKMQQLTVQYWQL